MAFMSRDLIQVSRAEYVDCNVYDDSETVMMLNCSSPRHRKRFTILFEPFQSIPNVPEYHAGGTYYFISQYIFILGLRCCHLRQKANKCTEDDTKPPLAEAQTALGKQKNKQVRQ